MNEDFETKLQRDIAAAPRHDATSGWKADILARAQREVKAIPPTRTAPPPRWLMTSWAACWIAIGVLHLTGPSNTFPPVSEHISTAKPAPLREASSAPSEMTLFAFHQHLNLNLDQP